MLTIVMLAAVAAGAPAGKAPSLDHLAAALRSSHAWRADFVQTYTPVGFEQGTSEPGVLTLVPPAKLRFDYATGGGRSFAVDGTISRLVDAKSGSCDAMRLDRGSWARLPLAAVLDPGAAEHTFAIEGSGEKLRLVPREPIPDLASVTITLDRAGMPQAVLVLDSSGDRNKFQFTHWQPTREPAAAFFAPSLPGSPPCLPED